MAGYGASAALAPAPQIAIFRVSSFWISHNGRMPSGRFLRVGSPRDPLFFVTEIGLTYPIEPARHSNWKLRGQASDDASDWQPPGGLRTAPCRRARHRGA